MATYKVGKVKINSTGLMTGSGTNWTAANALVRVGATVVLATSPVRIYTVGSIISATSIQLSDWGSDSAITSDTNYSILLHDGLTVQGLAQDTAETLRYYRNFESTLGDASKLNVGEASGNVMKVGAFGLGAVKPVNAMATKTYATALELMKDIRAMGSGWWRATAVTESGMGIFNHGSSFASVCADNQSILNVNFSDARVIAMATTTASMNAGSPPARNVLYGSANPPDINTETRGVLSVSNGGTGSNNKDTALSNLGVYDYITVKTLPTTGATESWFEIATINDSGAGGGYVSFIMSSPTGYGNGRMDTQIVTISARGLSNAINSGNLRLNITSKRFFGADNQGNASSIILGAIRVGTSNQFKLYARVPVYVGSARFTVTGAMGVGKLGGSNFIGGWIGNEVSTPNEVKTEPAGIIYAEPDAVLDDWMSKRHNAVFNSVTIEKDSNNEARILFNYEKDNPRGAVIRSTNTNGNMVISSGSNGSVNGEIFIRTTGENDSTKQFKFDKDGNATAVGGQWKNSSDIRLKRNFKGIESPLESVMSFRGATYEMKASGVRAIGVIAQDIEKRCPDAIGRMEIELEGEAITDAMSVDTAGFAAAYSVQALKEVVKLMDLMLEDPEAASARIKALKAMINDELPE